MTIQFDIIIVGGGHGGAHTAVALRQSGFKGSIAILTAEADAPYERPPLSKEYLAGRKPFERLLIRPPEFWADRAVTLRTHERVVAIDAARRQVTTKSGVEFGYGDLVWAAGGEARRLSCGGHDLDGVHTVRTRADVDRLHRDMAISERVIIVGGGYIGLETAATLTGLGKQVTVIEASPRLLSRVAGPSISRFVEREHRSNGIDVRLSSVIDRVEGVGGRACRVVLADGESLSADLVIVGIGIDPVVEPLRIVGAATGNGVIVDELGMTMLPNVHAIGDCALQPHPFASGRLIRIESVQNAVEMAGTVARALCGEAPVARSVPWFWSHQNDLRLQTIGFALDHDREVIHGNMADGRFSVAYVRDDHVIAIDCVNDPRSFVEARSLFSAPTENQRLDQRFLISTSETTSTERYRG
ncbi:pyridine nucleotide-disulfide oxidoreductase [Aureimonas sp. Leaf460]|nr:pyridine nucleotide-disulfide oxidoreductase [Aureimonas sp. Leaf427]KQT72364.1 pyridine nucleotide-disulfide oxidoreductase [Aureimonas sp. Leaf460]